MVTRCRIGFVGAGGVAARHARMLAGFGDVELVAVTDLDPDRARAFGPRAVPGVPELIDSGIDAAYVCVPPMAHGPAEEALAEAGIPMFVEKPIALDTGVADRVAAALDRAGVLASVGHHWRYSAAVERAREVLDGRPVRLAIGAWLDRVPPVPWWVRRDSSGGQVIEQAIHVLDLARLLAGEVTEVHAVADGAPPSAPDADVDGATVATLRFADGGVGTLVATCLLGWKHRAGLEVFADGLALSVAEDVLEVRDGDGAQVQRVDPDDAKRAADRDFVDAVLGRTAGVRTSYAEAVRTHRLAHAIARSATRGIPVRLDG
ncbi:Gfo/Idh/MocA family oxidoreductase [Amycolatopsis thermalba]|uniref:Gfo/Idh/MocA family oxidoreductase n=1 Tax=Amycolatopsis thermalba TaxID=944492 RepID=A0ABY4P0K5_9PSEU|nr:Gfo/Idh/MocA family oxidoreductase [Amycolatopsis thermalba]UQS25869.1 Gfo/Idh/MocA family oxidoreductase [Amycolatopsis thermalba]